MGTIYKKKKRSCSMCKPHKMHWADKKTNKERALVLAAEKYIRGEE